MVTNQAPEGMERCWNCTQGMVTVNELIGYEPGEATWAYGFSVVTSAPDTPIYESHETLCPICAGYGYLPQGSWEKLRAEQEQIRKEAEAKEYPLKKQREARAQEAKALREAYEKKVAEYRGSHRMPVYPKRKGNYRVPGAIGWIGMLSGVTSISLFLGKLVARPRDGIIYTMGWETILGLFLLGLICFFVGGVVWVAIERYSGDKQHFEAYHIAKAEYEKSLEEIKNSFYGSAN